MVELEHRPLEEGYTGTLAEFVETLTQTLEYGQAKISPGTSELLEREVLRIELTTRGWSTDEELISRVLRSPLLAPWWQSSHRGGLHVFEVIAHAAGAEKPQQWLPPATEADAVYPKTHTLRVELPSGTEHFYFPDGIELHRDATDDHTVAVRGWTGGIP